MIAETANPFEMREVSIPDVELTTCVRGSWEQPLEKTKMCPLFSLKFSTHKAWFIVLCNCHFECCHYTEALWVTGFTPGTVCAGEAGLCPSSTSSVLRGPHALSPLVWTLQEFSS